MAMTDAMSTMPNEELVQELIEAAKELGFEIGSDQGSRRAYKHAASQLRLLRQHVLLRLKVQCGLACHLDKVAQPTQDEPSSMT